MWPVAPPKNGIDGWMDGWIDKLSKKSYMKTRLLTHAQIYNGRIDFHQILHIHFLGEHGDTVESPSKLV